MERAGSPAAMNSTIEIDSAGRLAPPATDASSAAESAMAPVPNARTVASCSGF